MRCRLWVQNKRSFWPRAGLSVLEYSLLIVALMGALIATQLMLRRAISYKWRESADSVGFGRQYAPDGPKATVIVTR